MQKLIKLILAASVALMLAGCYSDEQKKRWSDYKHLDGVVFKDNEGKSWTIVYDEGRGVVYFKEIKTNKTNL